MENFSVEENVKLLMKELSVLMRTSHQRREDENDRWSKIVESSEREVHNICNKFYELRKGPNPKKKIAENKLNTEVKQVIKYLLCLQECVNIQWLQREVESDKPNMYSCRELESFTAGFSDEIGSGGYAKIYKGQFPAGTEIAVKVLEEKDALDSFLSELSTMGRTSHRYLIKLYGYCFEKEKKALVYEYMENGSLDSILYGNPHGLDWKKFYEIAINIAEGLSHLHHDCPETIIHYDIKPANVLIDSNYSPKITDFGLAKFMNQCLTHRINTGVKGTTNFIAPEVTYPWFEVNEKCDVYSFGMVLFEILGMKRLDRSKGLFPRQVWGKFMAGKLDDVLQACCISHENNKNAEILSMVALWCVQFKPTARPSMNKVVKMLKKQITLLNPPNPFPQFAESSMPTIQEEAAVSSVRTIQEEVTESSVQTIQEEVDSKLSAPRYSESSVGEISIPRIQEEVYSNSSPSTYYESSVDVEEPKSYSLEDLRSFTADFSSLIATGGFADIYEGQFPDGLKIAVKVLKEGDSMEEMFMAELSLMGKTYHSYVVKLYGYCSGEKVKALVYEYADKGSFDQILYGNPHALDWKKFYEIAINIAEGLSYLHNDCPETIIHHDVKAANVLIDSDFSPKITGFELSKHMEIGASHRTNTVLRGTANYMAPELVFPWAQTSPKCDVYSYGMLLFEILGMKRIKQHGEWFPKQVWEKFESGELVDVIEKCGISEENREDAEILSMVALWCVQITPNVRPSMSNVVKILQKKMQVGSPQNPFLASTEFSLPTIQGESFSDEQMIMRRPPTDQIKRYSIEDLANFTSHFSNEIGAGAFSKVYKGKFHDGVDVAVKVLEENCVQEETFMSHVSTIGILHHQHLVKLYGYCSDGQLKALVYEYMDKGSFDELLYDNPHGLEWEKFYSIAIAVAKGLSYLHENCEEVIIHHDLKPSNVLLDSKFSVKITDFGFAKLMEKDASHRTNTRMGGTPGYSAPELLFQSALVSSKCDVYSFGMLLFEILALKPNISGGGWFPKRVWEMFEAGKQLNEVIRECGISPKNRAKAEILSMVALWCAQFSPGARPSMSTVVYMLEREVCDWIPHNPFTPWEESPMPETQEELYPKASPSRIGVRYDNEQIARAASPMRRFRMPTTQAGLNSKASPSRFSESLREWRSREKRASN